MQILGLFHSISTNTVTWTPIGTALATTFKQPPVCAVAFQASRYMSQEKAEIFKSLEHWATQRVLPLIKPVTQCWQPIEFLPDPANLSADEFSDWVSALQERTAGFPDEYFVVLVDGMITEDALPTYQSRINTHEGVRDETGGSPSPWAVWTTEEHRHGDLLKTYLYLSGRVDMLMIDRTVQFLIGAGADVGTDRNPYLGYLDTSFQERATFVTHDNTARLAKKGGDPVLARICGTNIAADEKRHEIAYARIVEKLLEIVPNGAMLAISEMMKKKITMPAHLMHDGQDPHLFEHFVAVAQWIGVYTADDYANILEFFIWRRSKDWWVRRGVHRTLFVDYRIGLRSFKNELMSEPRNCGPVE